MKTKTISRSKNVWNEADALADVLAVTGYAEEFLEPAHDFKTWKWKYEVEDTIAGSNAVSSDQFTIAKADCTEKEAREQAMEYLGTFEGNLLEIADGANWIYEKVRQ